MRQLNTYLTNYIFQEWRNFIDCNCTYAIACSNFPGMLCVTLFSHSVPEVFLREDRLTSSELWFDYNGDICIKVRSMLASLSKR